MTTAERRALIRRYRDGYDEVSRALDGFPQQALTARPIADKWSAAEIVHHLADSESASALRLRRLLAEPHPVIQGYDQAEWARRLRYQERPLAPSLAMFKAARETTAQLLETMTEDEWRHLGWHTESGSYHAERWLEIYAEHAHGHAAQIRRLREVLGA
ncbi:MAG: DinB family protein [Candidatus Eisenbacteria bacterium]|nr:DinB family protein [Candidatus Eisenbacteria bacterium]